MKRIFSIFMAAVISAAAAVTAFAEDAAKYETAFGLFEEWMQTGYPDYVTGMWSTDGSMDNLTVGIVEAEYSEELKNELLSLVENKDTLSFAKQKYSKNYLRSIQEELTGYFGGEIALSSMGVYDMENYVGIDIVSDKMNPATEDFIRECTEKYGDAVHFEFGDAAVDLEEILYVTTATEEKATDSAMWIAFAAVAVLLVGGAAIVIISRRRSVSAGADGTLAATDSISDEQLESIVSETDIAPSAELDEKILSITKK